MDSSPYETALLDNKAWHTLPIFVVENCYNRPEKMEWCPIAISLGPLYSSLINSGLASK